MSLSPMMQQYMDIAAQYPDCILFFRLGDFYEMFFEDAKVVSKELDLVLTGNSADLKNVRLCAAFLFMPAIPILRNWLKRATR